MKAAPFKWVCRAQPHQSPRPVAPWEEMGVPGSAGVNHMLHLPLDGLRGGSCHQLSRGL